jgi:saxitoxin biosynthesis operon SxtJ-like protein
MAKGPKNPERSFGVSVGGVLVVIALLLWWKGRVGRAEILGVTGGVLLFFGVVQPRLLKWPSAVWWKFAGVLAYVNSRILLTIMFSLLLVPLSLVWRAIGKDPLARRRKKFEGWAPYPVRYRDRTHFERMF